LHLKFIADESLDFGILNELRDKGFDVISVLKEYQGISDQKVLELARQYNAVIIIEDKDFGEWIFAHKERNASVIFLRYMPDDMKNISTSLIALINKYKTDLYGKFVVVTVKKIRVREAL
jgi:predicted nuclease of predicted toxin-antitoxin system